MARKHPQFFTARRLPQAHRLVSRSAGDRPPVRAERNAVDLTPVAQLQNGAPCRVVRSGDRRRGLDGRLPQPHGTVMRSAGDRPTVRAERNAQDTILVARKHPQFFTARRVPQAHRIVTRSAGDRPTVRAERNA